MNKMNYLQANKNFPLKFWKKLYINYAKFSENNLLYFNFFQYNDDHKYVKFSKKRNKLSNKIAKVLIKKFKLKKIYIDYNYFCLTKRD